MVVTQSLTYKYPQGSPFAFPDIKVDSKECLLILGKSGIGKSTLLHLLGGLMKPNNGSILIDQKDLSTLNTSDLDRFRGENIGIVFQQNHFIDALTVEENILLAQSILGRKSDKTRAHSLLSSLGLAHKTKSKIKELSQGERQRVAICRALMNKPKLILADEPTSALDDENCQAVYHLLTEQAQAENCALIIVTHDGRLTALNQNHISLQ
jgi:ABC-type lipoprotein export system ATPase subunit